MSIRRFEDTNTQVFKITSAGAAYTLTLGFEPDIIEWWNYTKFATNDQNISGVWVSGMPAGDAVIVRRGTTDLTSTLETTNGVTELDDGSGFAATQLTPTAITAASPAVVTSAAHGLVDGQFIRGTNFRAQPVASATGMYTLNNRVMEVGTITTNTFALFEPFTNQTVPVDTSADTAFVNNGVAQFNLIGQSLDTENPPPVFRVTLGSAIMANASDVLYVRASKANEYVNLGQV
jgi:hypothetical protein